MALVRTAALVLGAIYIVVGIVGFIPLFVASGGVASMPSASGSLLGIFPINALHNVVHLAIGAALLYGATATVTATMVARAVGAVYVLVALVGIPFPDGFGLLPLGGTDVLLHLGTGIVLLALGFMAPVTDAPLARRA